jgi:hypothetical protein
MLAPPELMQINTHSPRSQTHAGLGPRVDEDHELARGTNQHIKCALLGFSLKKHQLVDNTKPLWELSTATRGCYLYCFIRPLAVQGKDTPHANKSFLEISERAFVRARRLVRTILLVIVAVVTNT